MAPVGVPGVALLGGNVCVVDGPVATVDAAGTAAVVVLEGQLPEPTRSRVHDDAPIGTESPLERNVVGAEQRLARDPLDRVVARRQARSSSSR